MDWKKHNEARERLIDELDRGTPRALRARRFANQVMALVQDFIPRDRDCLRRLDDKLTLEAFAADVEIVNVPPERDLDLKAALRTAEVSLSPKMVIPITGNN